MLAHVTGPRLSPTAPSSPVLLAGALLVGLCGCTVGPHYVVPTSMLTDFHSADSVAARAMAAPAPPLDRWWEGFEDPELTRIVRRALDQNLEIAAALARVDQARAAARGAGARLLPSFDLSTQIEGQHQSLESPTGAIARNLPGYDRDQALYDAGTAASWEIDLFGGLQRAAEAAAAEAEAAEAARIGVRIAVAAEAADAYLRVRGDQLRIAVATEQVTTNARLLDLVQRRFATGLAPDLEVAQAEALLAGASVSLRPLRIELQAQSNRLDVLTGAQPGGYATTLQAATVPAAPAIAGGGPTELLRRRPDIIAAERRLAASNARIGAAVSEYYPKFSLSALLGFESGTPDHLFRAATFQPQGLLGLRWRLFDFGKVDAQVAVARGADAEALARYRQSVLLAAEDVENAFTALVQLDEQVRELEREVSALRRARDLSETAYQGGVSPLTDVLDANRQLLVAQDAHARARTDAARAAVSAFRALGGGWSAQATVVSEVTDVRKN
ncbi:MAG: efflux transporter outer membrane subunit [Gammaproteobacteria bacterium]|nr:efflux transporter outer membrane subunit [Gammaproteobacteria bacterium]